MLALAAALATAVWALPAARAEPRPVDEFTTARDLGGSAIKRVPAREAWKQAAPAVREIRIRSSADGTEQPALFYAPDAPEPRPLLVALHSWSSDHLDYASIPYGVWAMRNGWVFMHPGYRGRFNRPEATGSELATRDVVDALAYAKRHARVDGARVYVVGYSGGGMMALIMAGRHPELWTAVVAWVPVFDLVAWYPETKRAHRRYAREIRRSCGGEPVPGTKAAAECRRRSPRTYLAGARGTGVRVYIATGIEDGLVSPKHALAAFNLLADERDRFTAGQIRAISERAEVPPEIRGPYHDADYESVGRRLLLQRTSGQVTLLLFEGPHDVVYNAGLFWLAGEYREPAGD